MPVEFQDLVADCGQPTRAEPGQVGQVLDLLPDDVGVTILTPADAPQIYTAVDTDRLLDVYRSAHPRA